MGGREDVSYYVTTCRLWKEKCVECGVDESVLKSSARRRPSGAITNNQWKQVCAWLCAFACLSVCLYIAFVRLFKIVSLVRFWPNVTLFRLVVLANWHLVACRQSA